jgi:hypothetical protein
VKPYVDAELRKLSVGEPLQNDVDERARNATRERGLSADSVDREIRRSQVAVTYGALILVGGEDRPGSSGTMFADTTPLGGDANCCLLHVGRNPEQVAPFVLGDMSRLI